MAICEVKISCWSLAIDVCWWTLLSDMWHVTSWAACFVSWRNPESRGSKKFPMELYGTIWNIIEYHTHRIHICYYMVTFTIHIPQMLAYIPAPWILWDIISWSTRFHDVLRLIDFGGSSSWWGPGGSMESMSDVLVHLVKELQDVGLICRNFLAVQNLRDLRSCLALLSATYSHFNYREITWNEKWIDSHCK